MQVEIDDELYHDSENLFRQLGLTTDQAVQIFLTKSLINKGLPFSLTLDEKVQAIDSPDITNSEITDSLLALVENQLSDSEIRNLLDIDYCKERFAISFSVLKLVASNQQDDVRVAVQDLNGHNRYSTKKIAKRDGCYYVICTQWTDRHRAAFIHWRDLFSQ